MQSVSSCSDGEGTIRPTVSPPGDTESAQPSQSLSHWQQRCHHHPSRPPHTHTPAAGLPKLRGTASATLQATLSPGCKLFVDLFAGSTSLRSRRALPVWSLWTNFTVVPSTCSTIRSSTISVPLPVPVRHLLRTIFQSAFAPGGPKAVRTPEFPTGIPDPSPVQQSELTMSALLHERTRHFLSLVL